MSTTSPAHSLDALEHAPARRVASEQAASFATSETSAAEALCDRSIGDILRQANGLTAEQVQNVLAYQRERGVRFGEAAVALGYLRGEDIMWALSQQFHYPYVPEASELSEELVVAKEPFSEKAELFRSIRSQLMVRKGDHGGPGFRLSVVSAHEGEGRTFFAANLAVAFSQLGGRTLLVDGNMRKPRLHKVFDVNDESGRGGLSGILSGRASTQAILPIAGLPSLFLLPVGTVPPNPLELVARPAFGLLMKELHSKFDHIVIDTPAAALGTDCAVIAAACDCALVVARAGATSLPATRELVKHVQMGKTDIAGVVMNRI